MTSGTHRRSRHRFALVRAAIELALVLALLSAGRAGAGGGITFKPVAPARTAAPGDYASEVRGYYWDFSNPSRYNVENTRRDFSKSALRRGWFTGTMGRADAKIWLQRFNLPQSVVLPSEGWAKPIDTSMYRYFTTRMCFSKDTAIFVYWFKEVTEFGGAGFVNVHQGCGIYTLDLVEDRNPGGGPLAWNAGPVQTIAIRAGTETGIQVAIDYVVLSPAPPDSPTPVVASWQPGAGKFDLYLDAAGRRDHLTLLAEGVSARAGRYELAGGLLAPGRYQFIARRPGGDSASKPFSVNAPPRVNLIAPSFTSGPDYAALNGGAWNMSKTTDISRADNVANVTWAGGVYCATNTNNDPALYLRVPTPIDPSEFFYATFRMKILGSRDLLRGSVARYLWHNGTTFGTTQDIVDYEGWQIVSLDLREALLETGQNTWLAGNKQWFRLDPHEFPETYARRFCVDYVRLNGISTATSRYMIRYAGSDPDGKAPEVSFFFTKTRGATTGGNPITCLPSAAGRCKWNVSQVAPGNYYVYAVAKDSKNTTVTPSDVPVGVR
jgi:hypothetical protein